MHQGERFPLSSPQATGMARATALEFANESAVVSIFDTNDAKGQKTVTMIRDQGAKAGFFQCDVTKAGAIDAAFDASVADFGPDNVLLNHAGSIIVKLLHHTTEDEYDWPTDFNVESAFLVWRRAVKEMADTVGGPISTMAAEMAKSAMFGSAAIWRMT